MGIFDFFGKKPLPAFLYDLHCELHPFRLKAHKNDAIDLEVRLVNTTTAPLLTSVIISVPRTLGMDQTGLSHEKEVRMGVLQPGEHKQFRVGVFSNQKSAPGSYPVRVHATAHYHDYGHVMNQVRQTLTVRVE